MAEYEKPIRRHPQEIFVIFNVPYRNGDLYVELELTEAAAKRNVEASREYGKKFGIKDDLTYERYVLAPKRFGGFEE